jgi:hypothetical protein
MLKLLLDEHLSPEIAEGLRRRVKTLTVHALAEWKSGRFLGESDVAILSEAASEKLTLVTYDLKTIPPLLKAWMEAGRDHGGVIFVDIRTIPSSDFGGLVRALQKLCQSAGKSDWTNEIYFLRRQG